MYVAPREKREHYTAEALFATIITIITIIEEEARARARLVIVVVSLT